MIATPLDLDDVLILDDLRALQLGWIAFMFSECGCSNHEQMIRVRRLIWIALQNWKGTLSNPERPIVINHDAEEMEGVDRVSALIERYGDERWRGVGGDGGPE